MKRIKGDQIHAAVGQYLKRRHYMESVDVTHKRETKGTQGLQQVVLQKTVAWEGDAGNAIAYSSITGDVTACDQQYTKFKQFLTEAVEPYHSELKPLMFPVFVHVFLELLCNGQKTPAHKFLSRHSSIFKDTIEQKPVLESLSHMFSREDMEADKKVIEFRDHKYCVRISEEAMTYLFRYLKAEDNVLLLQMFNEHIDLKVQALLEGEDVEQREERFAERQAAPSPPCTPDNKVIRNEVNLSSLQQCIKRVRDGPPCLTSICFYTFLNTYQGLCSAHISSDQSMLSGSFEDSTIKVWSLTPKPLDTQAPGVDINQVYLAGDYEEDVKARKKATGQKECVTLRGHSGAIYSTCFTNDNKYLLSASQDTTVRLWDLSTHTNVSRYSGHNYPVWDIDASMVNGYFASCSHDRTAKLWCTDRTFPIRTFVGHVQDVDCIRFHPNSSYLATGSGDKTVRLWSLQEGRPVRLFQGHRATVLALAFSPDGNYLASAGEDRRVRVWELSTGTLLKDLRGHTDTVYALSFNRDSTMLASGGLDCMLRVWDIRKNASSNSPVDSHSSPELLGAFPTKSTSVHFLRYAQCNLLYAAGSFAS